MSRYNIYFGQKTVEEEIGEKLADRHRVKLSLRPIAALPIQERYKLLEESVVLTAKNFLNSPELTEFSVLDGKDWGAEND